MTRRATPTPPMHALRRHPLSLCLAAAMVLQAGAAWAAPPAAPVPRGNLVVQNCDDSGTGSLRDVVGSATEGATVDLAGLTCASITLTGGAIVIGADIANLTVTGPGPTSLAISGSDADRLFSHQGSGTLTLSGLTLSHGHGADSGGCVFSNGSVAMTSVTVSDCVAGTAEVENTAGGGVAATGNVSLTDCQFIDNRVDGTLRVRGGAVSTPASITATGSTFTGNRAHAHLVVPAQGTLTIAEGGALQALGSIDLTGSTVSGNVAMSDTAEAFGGGISVGTRLDDVQGSLDVLDSSIDGNSAESTCEVCAPQGGGIAVVGIPRLRRTLLTNNSASSSGAYGGAGGMRVFSGVSAEIFASTISGNHADSAGGGVIGPESGTLSIDGSTLSSNFAGNLAGGGEGGGGILCLGCNVQLSSSTVSGNTAEADGGGINIRYGEYAPAPLAIIDSTISGNTSGAEGGGIMLDGGDAQVSNSTIAFNTAVSRGAGLSASEYSYRIELQSAIISNNLTGDAANNVWAFPDAVSGANNLVPNAPGLPAAMPDDTLTGDPLLQPLADNGGATFTHALGAASPALDAGNNAIGLVFDQRGDGFMREIGLPDIGAFEQQKPLDADAIFVDGFDAD